MLVHALCSTVRPLFVVRSTGRLLRYLWRLVMQGKFKPTTKVRLHKDEDIVNFVREFLDSYLTIDDNKRFVKEYFDASCRNVNTVVKDKWQCFTPDNITKKCIIECTDHDKLCSLLTFGEPPSPDNDISGLHRGITNLLMNDNKDLYHKLCELLDIKVTVGFSLMSPEPYVPQPSTAIAKPPSARRFVPRGGGEREGINTGLKEDRKSFIDFMNKQPYAWYSDLSDRQENVDLPKGDMRSKEQVMNFIKASSLVNLPKGSEVIIYFAGHGEEGTGDWGAYEGKDMVSLHVAMEDIEGEEVLSLHVAMEDILDAWIEREKMKDPGDKLRLTIISDCCYSNEWVKRLQEDIAKGGGSKYGRYPICIQGAASEDAYECTLLPLLLHNGDPLCAGQDPTYVSTSSYDGPPPAMFKERLTNDKDYEAMFAPGSVPSRRDLERASGKVKKMCEEAIQKWNMDGPADKGKRSGTIIRCGKARIDLQGLTGKGKFCNLQVQVGDQSYAQVHIQSALRPGAETIKKYLKQSLDETETYWFYVDEKDKLSKFHIGNGHPTPESDFTVGQLMEKKKADSRLCLKH